MQTEGKLQTLQTVDKGKMQTKGKLQTVQTSDKHYNFTLI